MFRSHFYANFIMEMQNFLAVSVSAGFIAPYADDTVVFMQVPLEKNAEIYEEPRVRSFQMFPRDHDLREKVSRGEPIQPERWRKHLRITMNQAGRRGPQWPQD